jgi:hypothetical protein
MLKTIKMAYQEGYLKCDVFDGKTMDIKASKSGKIIN